MIDFHCEISILESKIFIVIWVIYAFFVKMDNFGHWKKNLVSVKSGPHGPVPDGLTTTGLGNPGQKREIGTLTKSYSCLYDFKPDLIPRALPLNLCLRITPTTNWTNRPDNDGIKQWTMPSLCQPINKQKTWTKENKKQNQQQTKKRHGKGLRSVIFFYPNCNKCYVINRPLHFWNWNFTMKINHSA